MSQTVIFTVGIVVFALTVWGSVMAAGIWLGQLADPDDLRPSQEPLRPERGLDAPPPTP